MRATFIAIGTAAVLMLAGPTAAHAAAGDITITGPATVAENADHVDFTITREIPLLTASSATVDVTVAGITATAGTDFTLPAGTATLAGGLLGGTSTATVSVPITDDALDEADETFSVTISNASAGQVAAPDSVTTAITDDDPSPNVSLGDATVAEGTGTAGPGLSIPVTLSAVSGRDVSIDYATGGGTATAGSDYTPASGTLTIPAGQTTGTIHVPVLPDAVDEEDETVTVTATNPVNASLVQATATGTISDDDTASITLTGASASEAVAGGVTYAVVNLSTTSSRTVTVHYATHDGTAVAPGDYTAATGTATIAPGQRTALIPLTIVNDTTYEPDEAFSVTIDTPSGAAIATGGNAAIVVIRNDDAVPSTSPGGSTQKPPVAVIPIPVGNIRLSTLRFSRTTGTMTFVVTCPGGSGHCKGSLTVFTVPALTSKVKALRKEQQLVAKRFDIPAGSSVTLSLRLPARAKGWLRAAKRVPVNAYVVSKDAQGAVTTAHRRGVLRR